MAPARRRRRWLIGGVLVLVVGAWCAIAAVSLLDAKRQAQAGLDRLSGVRGHLGATAVVRGDAAADVEAARADFARAHERAGSWALAPFRFLPILGRQVRSVDALTASAEHVAGVGATAMRSSRREVDARPQSGPARVQLVEQLGGIAGRSRAQLDALDLGPSDALIGPLATARSRFSRELDRLRGALSDVRDAADGLSPLLRGPARYLVFAANNAEMRSGSGMFLSVGVLTFDNGSFTLSPMTPTGELTLPPGAVPITGDFAARWGWTHPNEEWRNLATTPRFDASAALAAQMWRYQTGSDVDGVLAIDAVAVQSLLAATGPVEVDGLKIDANNVVSQVLLEQYRANAAAPGDDVQQARRERLSAIARSAVAALDQGALDTGALLDQLRTAAEGRHVLAWSSKPDQQQAWRAAGIDGELRADSMLLGVLNRGGNKLDQFLDVAAARVDTARHGSTTAVTVRATLTNNTPGGLPRYVAGPFPGQPYASGTYLGIFSLDVPGAARDISIDRNAPLVAAGADGPARVVATDVQLAPGEHRDLVVTFTLPSGVKEMRVEPTARVPGVRWTHRATSWVDGAARTVRW